MLGDDWLCLKFIEVGDVGRGWKRLVRQNEVVNVTFFVHTTWQATWQALSYFSRLIQGTAVSIASLLQPVITNRSAEMTGIISKCKWNFHLLLPIMALLFQNQVKYLSQINQENTSAPISLILDKAKLFLGIKCIFLLILYNYCRILTPEI